MPNNKKRLLLSPLFAVVVFISEPVFSVGFKLPNQDPEGIARGNAFVASADNPSAIYHNPAGITQLEGNQASIGAYLVSAVVVVETSSGARGQTDSGIQAVPQIHFVSSPKDSSISYGFGVYAPYGLGISYGDNSPFPTLATKANLAYVSFNPVIAYDVSDALSIGFGLTLNYSEVEVRQAIGIQANDRFRFIGRDTDIGFNTGILWHINRHWSAGLNYRSETTMDYDGRSQATSSPFNQDYVDTQGSLVFPQYVDLGVAYKPNDLWTIEVNVDWTDWNAVDSVVFEGTALGDLPFNLNYESSYIYELGITRQLKNDLLLSTGYIYAENSVPDTNFTPFNPDANLHLGSIGISNRESKIGWSLSYHFAYNGGRTVSNNQTGSLLGEVADGEYKTFNQALNAALTFKF